MTDHVTLSDEAFYDQMESCVYRKKFFSHLAHLRLGWIHIDKFGAAEAEKTAPAQIKKFVTHLGLSDKFNHTLSVAAIKILHHHIIATKAGTFDQLIEKRPELQEDFRGLIAKHYTDQVYTNPAAKTGFVQPDRIPF